MKYLTIDILSAHDTILNVRNNYERFVIECPDGYLNEAEVKERNYGIIRIVPGNLPNTLKALFVGTDNNVLSGGMFGGAFLYTSDSRYGDECKRVLKTNTHFSYPVPIHDRFEY